MFVKYLGIVAAAVALTWTAGGCQAAPPDTALKVGDKAPDWSDIIGTDGKKHALADYKNAKLVVLVFTCNHCPVARAFEPRLIALQKDYQDKGVQLVAVNVNNIPPDRLEAMKRRASDRDFKFPYLYDSTQAIGKNYGATVTPHAFILDGKRKIAYMGAVEDTQNPDAVKEHYVRDALDSLLAGKEPKTPVTQQYGCGIRYEE
jgi:peroxiredoxin